MHEWHTQYDLSVVDLEIGGRSTSKMFSGECRRPHTRHVWFVMLDVEELTSVVFEVFALEETAVPASLVPPNILGTVPRDTEVPSPLFDTLPSTFPTGR
jgi:hypothetical protein